MTKEIKITDQQIKSLMIEAGAAGDLEMVAICQRALDGDLRALWECDRVIEAAQE